MKDLDISVATESQRGEVTPPRPHSWSVAKLDIMWRQYPPVLVLPLLAIAKGREFSSESVFCYNPKSHTSTTRRAHSSGLLLSSCPLGSMLSLCSGCSTTWNIIPSRPPAFQPSSAHHTLQDLSPAKWGPLLNVFPKKRPYFPAGRCIQATFSLLSHTDKGFRKCQLSWLWFTFFNTLFFFHV